MNKIKVEQRFVINDKPVDKVDSFGGLDVFAEYDGEDAWVKYYFTKAGAVLKTLFIMADEGHGQGYICQKQWAKE